MKPERATRSELSRRWGRLRVTEGTTLDPKVIERSAWGHAEVWRHIGGKGLDAMFEKMP